MQTDTATSCSYLHNIPDIDRAPTGQSPPHASSENLNSTSATAAAGTYLYRPPAPSCTHLHIHELSDIREVSGSSRATPLTKPSVLLCDKQETTPVETTPEPRRAGSDSSDSHYVTPSNLPLRASGMRLGGVTARTSSVMSLPLSDVPPRRSSASVLGQTMVGPSQGSLEDFPSWKLPPSSAACLAIPTRGRSDSPVRRALAKDPVSSDLLRPSASRTFIRTVAPLDILEIGSSRHSRVEMTTHLPSPLFVGGGTIEGQVSLEVDKGTARKTKLNPIFVSKLSIDVIGVEEVSDGRQRIFLSLATELFDSSHPPPPTMVTSQTPLDGTDLCWQLKPSAVSIPFCLDLPLNLGPPPYLSKQARIRYLLCPTAVVKVGAKKSTVRQTWNIQMLTVHDPIKALASLPSPLLAADMLSLSHGTDVQTLRLTAGLHRQIWVNGAMIFVDIHIANNGPKPVKRLEVQVEKTTLWYTHAAAGTVEKSASHLRLPRKSDSEVVSTNVMKRSKEWAGVPSHSSEVRTCEVNAPRGHVTISTGRYFEVRYFLNVIASISMFKTVAVQLPVTLIHINSLDVLPNALAQVAASIEAKRTSTVPVPRGGHFDPPYHQGQAFIAPQRQSLDRARDLARATPKDEIGALTLDLDNSPRRYARPWHYAHQTLKKPRTSISSENMVSERNKEARSCHDHQMHCPSCYHCHLLYDIHPRTLSSLPPGPRLPRLQLSTSGLGFSDSEFEVPPDSPPRKVMLSESERKMIRQQRELTLQRKMSCQSQMRKRVGDQAKAKVEDPQERYWGWKNVVAGSSAEPKQHAFGHRSEGGPIGHRPQDSRTVRTSMSAKDIRPGRDRSKTNPERLTFAPAPKRHPRGARSMDRVSHGHITRPGDGDTGILQPKFRWESM